MALLEARTLHSGYGETEILHGVSLHVEPGEVVVLIGPNGAGKSTVMKTLFGLLRPTRGQVLLEGRDITGVRPERLVRRGMSYVPQTDNVFPSLTIQENLEMGAFVRRDDFGAALLAVYERFPALAERRRVRAGTLSGGERQMLAMGKALMLEPRLLLLDEPSAGLAPRMVEEIFAHVAGIAAGGVGVLIIEQNARQALKIAGRGYVLAMGRVRIEEAGPALLAHPDLPSLYLGA
jgi:branched-chain amino acid transport system ATP-binding protein